MHYFVCSYLPSLVLLGVQVMTANSYRARDGESGVHHILLVFVLMLYLCLCNFISQCHCTILALVV